VKASALEVILLRESEVIMETLPRRYLSKFLTEAEIKLILTMVICRIKRGLCIPQHQI